MRRLLPLLLPLVVLAACGGASKTDYCANWSCGGSSQCASDMGGPSGSQCGFGNLSDCQAWCQTYIPGNCSCGGGSSAPTLSYVTVTPGNAVLAIGLTQQYTATAHYSDGSSADVTGQATWGVVTTSGSNVASITAGGLVTALALGAATVSATYSGHSGSTTLTTAPVAITWIEVAPANPTIAKGQTQAFTATAHWSDGHTTDVTATGGWSSQNTGVATMSGAVATGQGAGTATIVAYAGGKSGSTLLTVTGPLLVSVAVRPSAPTIATGTSRQLTAIGTWSDNTAQDVTLTASWVSSVTTVATVGVPGVVNGIAPGTSAVSAAMGDVTGLTTVTVTPATLQGVSISPPQPSVGPGDTLTFSAIGSFSDGTSYPIPAGVTWASSAPATVAVDPSGAATAISIGTASLSASYDGVVGATTVTVTSSPPGTTWTWRPTGSTLPGATLSNYQLNAIVWTGTQLVTAGAPGFVLTSPDGLAWSVHASGPAGVVNALAWAPELGLLVAVGSGIWTSSDGITWVANAGVGHSFSAVAWSGTRFVAVGDKGIGSVAMYASPDGFTWTQQDPATAQVLDAIVWNGAQFVATGNATVVSADGLHWTLSPDTSSAWTGIAWSGTKFVKVAFIGATVSTSTDGLHWTSAPPFPVSIWGVIWANNRFVAVGGTGASAFAFTSKDGVSWATATVGPVQSPYSSRTFRAVAWTGARLVGVGDPVWTSSAPTFDYFIETSP